MNNQHRQLHNRYHVLKTTVYNSSFTGNSRQRGTHQTGEGGRQKTTLESSRLSNQTAHGQPSGDGHDHRTAADPPRIERTGRSKMRRVTTLLTKMDGLPGYVEEGREGGQDEARTAGEKKSVVEPSAVRRRNDSTVRSTDRQRREGVVTSGHDADRGQSLETEVPSGHNADQRQSSETEVTSGHNAGQRQSLETEVPSGLNAEQRQSSETEVTSGHNAGQHQSLETEVTSGHNAGHRQSLETDLTSVTSTGQLEPLDNEVTSGHNAGHRQSFEADLSAHASEDQRLREIFQQDSAHNRGKRTTDRGIPGMFLNHF